ncbi:ProQ/FINO family protein [Vibrio sp. 10N.239.312.D08]|uniref:ProQ/FINO family protein n=1 Tax=Vibrio sp. 10N.239.312.D08 TaxID=3229978 RepID=UPI00354B9936
MKTKLQKINALPPVDRENAHRKYANINSAFKTLVGYRLPMPFAVGIGQELQQRMRHDGFGANHSRRAINRLVSSRRYLQAIIDSDNRYNLDGSIAEAVTDEQRTHAVKQLCIK